MTNMTKTLPNTEMRILAIKVMVNNIQNHLEKPIISALASFACGVPKKLINGKSKNIQVTGCSRFIAKGAKGTTPIEEG